MDQTLREFLREWADSGLIDQDLAEAVLAEMDPVPESVDALALQLVHAGRLTMFQAQQIRWGAGKSLVLRKLQPPCKAR